MNFNILKNVPSAIFALSASARVRNSAVATVILLLLVFVGFVQAAGDAEWAAQARQVNDLLRQMRMQTQGVPGAIQYVNQAEKLWKQAQDQWAMQQRHQQQSGWDQIQKQLLDRQKNLLDHLVKQQQFLQQPLKTPQLKTTNEFGDYLAHGVSIRPEDGRLHNAKEGAGKEAWEEAKRWEKAMSEINGISSILPWYPTLPSASSQTPPKKGDFYNPFGQNQKPTEEQIAQKKSEIAELERTMREIQAKRVKKEIELDGMFEHPAFVTDSFEPGETVPRSLYAGKMEGNKIDGNLSPAGMVQDHYLAEEQESLAAAMKYQVGVDPESLKTLKGVREAELHVIKAEHIKLGDRLQKAKGDFEKLENEKRFWETWEKTVDTVPKEPLFNGIGP
jgi:hypothetical protein